MLAELVAKTGYKIAAKAISKSKKLQEASAPRIVGQLSSDVAEFGKKVVQPYRPIVLPKLDAQQIGELEKLDDDNFIRKSHSIICKILGIPQEISPQVAYLPFDEPNSLARYNVSLHRIELPNDFFEMSSRGQFSTLAHEIKHADQSLALLRSSKLSADFLKSESLDFDKFNYPAKDILVATPARINNPNDLLGLHKKVVGLLGELPEKQTQYVRKFLLPSKETGSLGYFLSTEEIEAYIFERLVSSEYKKAARKYYSTR